MRGCPGFLTAGLLALVALLGACSGASSMNDGGTTGAGPVLDGGSDQFFSTGSFMASGPDSGIVKATFMDLPSRLDVTEGGALEFGIVAVQMGSEGSFTSPSGVTDFTITADIFFHGPPKAGMTVDNSSSCGEVSVAYGNLAVSELDIFEARGQGDDCAIRGPNAGSWTLTLSSVSPTMGLGSYYFIPHGSLTATVVDDSGDTGTASFTF